MIYRPFNVFLGLPWLPPANRTVTVSPSAEAMSAATTPTCQPPARRGRSPSWCPGGTKYKLHWENDGEGVRGWRAGEGLTSYPGAASCAATVRLDGWTPLGAPPGFHQPRSLEGPRWLYFLSMNLPPAPRASPHPPTTDAFPLHPQHQPRPPCNVYQSGR